MSVQQLKKQVKSLQNSKRFAWGQYYGEMSERFDSSYSQVQQVRETLKEVIPEHIKTMLKKLIKKAEEDIKCPICLDEIEGKEDMNVSNCGHFLCKECYDELKDMSPYGVVRCPECRKNQ